MALSVVRGSWLEEVSECRFSNLHSSRLRFRLGAQLRIQFSLFFQATFPAILACMPRFQGDLDRLWSTSGKEQCPALPQPLSSTIFSYHVRLQVVLHKRHRVPSILSELVVRSPCAETDDRAVAGSQDVSPDAGVAAAFFEEFVHLVLCLTILANRCLPIAIAMNPSFGSTA